MRLYHNDKHNNWMDKMSKWWRLWAKAIGEKEGTTDAEADRIAMIRTIIVGVNFITCFFIIAGNIHNW